MRLTAGDFYQDVENPTTLRKRAGLGIAVSGALYSLWRAIALTLYVLLEVFDGIICTLLAGLAILIAGTALLFEYAADLPRFPFWGLMAASGACALTMVLYYGLMRLLKDSLGR